MSAKRVFGTRSSADFTASPVSALTFPRQPRLTQLASRTGPLVCARGGDDPSRASSSARARHVLHGRTGLRSPRRRAPVRPARPFLNVTPFGPERPRGTRLPTTASRPRARVRSPRVAPRRTREIHEAREIRVDRVSLSRRPRTPTHPAGPPRRFPTPPDRLPRRPAPRTSRVQVPGVELLRSHPTNQPLRSPACTPLSSGDTGCGSGGHPRGAGRGRGEGQPSRFKRSSRSTRGRRGDEAGQRPRHARIRTPGALSLPERIVRADRLGVRKGEDGECVGDPAERDAAEAEDPPAQPPIRVRSPNGPEPRTTRPRIARSRVRSFVQRRYAVSGAWRAPDTARISPRRGGLRRGLRGTPPPTCAARSVSIHGFARRSPIDARGDFIRRRPSRACACLHADRRVCVGGTRRWARGCTLDAARSGERNRPRRSAAEIASPGVDGVVLRGFETRGGGGTERVDRTRAGGDERAERAEVAESSAERRARNAERGYGARRRSRFGSNPIEKSPRRRSARNRRTLRDASARLEGALAASHVRLRAAEAPVGIAAAAGPASARRSAGFRIPRGRTAPPPPNPKPSPECCVCAEEYANERVRHMFVGCQHACVCRECADVIWKRPNKRACPICREKVKREPSRSDPSSREARVEEVGSHVRARGETTRHTDADTL